MATYKLIQNVEAEDHIVGPLSLRQFIFALISIFFFYISFIALAKFHSLFLLIIVMPPAIFFGFFAIPFGRDQPTEIWFLAKLRFWFKPRKRIWNQSGIKELVTITAPKKIDRILTNGLSTYEVQSRLKSLANTLDSRGWAVKNYSQFADTDLGDSDRLINVSSAQPPMLDDGAPVGADILDESTSPVAQQFNQMIDQSNQLHRQQLMEKMNNTVSPTSKRQSRQNQWFMPHIDTTRSVTYAMDVPPSQETQADINTVQQIKSQQSTGSLYNSHLRTLQPLNSDIANSASKSNQTSSTNLTNPSDPAIIQWANNDDVTVQTIARQLHKNNDADSDEIVVSLH